MAGKGKSTKQKKSKKKHGRQETRKYGQAVLRHSHMGVRSCCLWAGAWLLFLIALLFAFLRQGEAAGFIGGFGILAVVFSVWGVWAGVKGLREREKKYITCKFGIAMNVLSLLGLLIIFVGGIS